MRETVTYVIERRKKQRSGRRKSGERTAKKPPNRCVTPNYTSKKSGTDTKKTTPGQIWAKCWKIKEKCNQPAGKQ